jgi:hypothetical protein
LTSAPPGDRKALFLQACALRRSIAFANPLLDFDDIVCMLEQPGEQRIIEQARAVWKGHSRGGGPLVIRDFKSKAVPVAPLHWIVTEATRLPSRAASASPAPEQRPEVMPAMVLSPAPTMSISPVTGTAGTRWHQPLAQSKIPRSPTVTKAGPRPQNIPAVANDISGATHIPHLKEPEGGGLRRRVKITSERNKAALESGLVH